jgi:PhzF family phenazine biosynthesis protein
MRLKLYQIDAFTGRVFSGNAAGVCPLNAWLPDATMQAIAAENNVGATAFFAGVAPRYKLRWFAPTMELLLCGHATLASAFVIMTELDRALHGVEFETKGGILKVTRDGELFTMDFPAYPPRAAVAPPRLAAALGIPAVEAIWEANKYLVLLGSETEVRALRPDFSSFDGLQGMDVIVTARGDDCDFVSRYFAPNHGIAEDPATGSTHCTLAPFWAERLGKSQLSARQVSQRGGELHCEMRGDRVQISGRCAKYLEGEFTIA